MATTTTGPASTTGTTTTTTPTPRGPTRVNVAPLEAMLVAAFQNAIPQLTAYLSEAWGGTSATRTPIGALGEIKREQAGRGAGGEK